MGAKEKIKKVSSQRFYEFSVAARIRCPKEEKEERVGKAVMQCMTKQERQEEEEERHGLTSPRHRRPYQPSFFLLPFIFPLPLFYDGGSASPSTIAFPSLASEASSSFLLPFFQSIPLILPYVVVPSRSSRAGLAPHASRSLYCARPFFMA